MKIPRKRHNHKHSLPESSKDGEQGTNHNKKKKTNKKNKEKQAKNKQTTTTTHKKGLQKTNYFGTATRKLRGEEALTLSVPNFRGHLLSVFFYFFYLFTQYFKRVTHLAKISHSTKWPSTNILNSLKTHVIEKSKNIIYTYIHNRHTYILKMQFYLKLRDQMV